MKLHLKQKLRYTYYQSILVSLMLITVAVFYFVPTKKVYSAANGDFRTKTSGNWNSTSTWEFFDGTNWVNATWTPSATDGIVSIENGHTVTIVSGVTVDQVQIQNGGIMILNSGVTLTASNGTGTDIEVFGTLKSAGTITINSGAEIVFQNQGLYQHNFTTTAGVIPTATWNTGSTCEIIGYTSNTSPPTGMQAFYNFKWNCPSQTGSIDLNGTLTTINGDFILSNSGSGQLRFSTASCTVNIAGNYIQTGGTLSTVNSNNKDSLIIMGNWTHTGGTLTMSLQSNARTYVLFNKAGLQTFTASGNSVVGKVNFIVASGAILDLGTSVLLGYDFTLQSGGALLIGSPDGITQSSNLGNVQCSNSRSYSTGADYTYNGASGQVTGDGLPSQVRDLTLNNSSNCTLTNSVSVSGTMRFTTGIWIATSDTLSLGTSTSNLGTLSRTSGHVYGYFRRWIAAAVTSNILFPLGSMSYYNPAVYSFTTAPSAGNILSTYLVSSPGTNGLPVYDSGDSCKNIAFGYWSFSARSGFAGGVYDVNLYCNGYPNIYDYTKLHLFRRASSGSSWSSNGTHSAGTGSNSAPVVNRVGMNLLGHFGITSGSANPLPIELINFTLHQEDHSVKVLWETASEINNDYFTVERSSDGINFNSICIVKGAGNSTRNIDYSIYDFLPLSGTFYYRLKQTDFDGKFSYSSIKSARSIQEKLSNTDKVISIESVFPIPFKDSFTIRYSLNSSESNLNIKLFSNKGEEFASRNVLAEKGINYFTYSQAESLPLGSYILILSNGMDSDSKLIIKN